MKKFAAALETGALGLVFALTTLPAMATPVPVPEPDTLSVFAIGIGGAYLVSKYLRRK